MNTSTRPTIAILDEQDTYARPRRWTRVEFHRAAEAGIFGDNERLELIDGAIYPMSPQTRKHFNTIVRIADVLEAVFGEGYSVEQQGPVGLTEDSEPELDVKVVVGDSEDYEEHPTPADIRLVVEVADTSLAKDRIIKSAGYARAGIQEYWILNLKDRLLEVQREPEEVHGEYVYKSVRIYTEAESVIPLAVPQASVRVADLFPRKPKPAKRVERQPRDK